MTHRRIATLYDLRPGDPVVIECRHPRMPNPRFDRGVVTEAKRWKVYARREFDGILDIFHLRSGESTCHDPGRSPFAIHLATPAMLRKIPENAEKHPI